MLGIGRCLGRPPQKDQSTKLDQVQRFGSTISSQSQIQASLPVTREQDPNPDEAKPRAEVVEEILKHIEREDVYQVVLDGEHGVGKTWIAKEVAKQAMLKHIVEETILIFYSLSDYDVRTSIAKLLLKLGVIRYYVDIEEENGVNRVIEHFREMAKKKKILLVCDYGAGFDKNLKRFKVGEEIERNEVENIESVIAELFDFENKISSKALVIKHGRNYDNNSNKGIVTMKINHLTISESKDLLQRNWNDEIFRVLNEEDVDKIVRRCKYLPAPIVYTGNVLLYALENARHDDLKRKLAIQEATKDIIDDEYWLLGCISGFDKFRNNVTHLRCFLLASAYLQEHGIIEYNELILCWMLEGCFDSVTSLDKAYDLGHNVLMDLLDAGLLGDYKGDYVIWERTGFKFLPYCLNLLLYDELVLSIISHQVGDIDVQRRNDTMVSFHQSKVKLFFKGNNSIFEQEKIIKMDDQFMFGKTKVLSFSHVNPIIVNFSMFNSLNILILRNCPSINYEELFENAKFRHNLEVLEISDCRTLKKLPDDFFVKFNILKVLNLSGTLIKSLPSFFNLNLIKISFLILRRCLELENFPNVSGLPLLKVLDLSGSKFNSLNKKPWILKQLPKLWKLDLSETNICELPEITELENLTHLFLKNCPLLKKLVPLNASTKLKVVDASGCSNLDYFGEENLPDSDSLLKLDLSQSSIREIPRLRNARNLAYLILKGCTQLKELPSIDGAKNLRMLDVSGAIRLEKINTCFEEMKSLQELLLSNTKIETLPSISGLVSLRKLILQGCEALHSLPKIDLLNNLLLVDVRGCIALQKTFFDEQFRHVTILSS